MQIQEGVFEYLYCEDITMHRNNMGYLYNHLGNNFLVYKFQCNL